MLKARALVVLPLAALLTIGAVRAMTFVAPPAHPLRTLSASFDGHPAALLNRALTAIGGAAAKGGSVPAAARADSASAARKAPLAAEPYLIEGTIAEMAGRPDQAETLFLAARARDPRSQGARYFLADRYLKTNRVVPGLVELGALARLSEKASQPMIPAIAAYAKTPGAIPHLTQFFKLSPTIRDSTLAALAEDARNAPLILALAPGSLHSASVMGWGGRLIASLNAAGDYAGAEMLWSRIAGVAGRGLVYDPQFRDKLAPPPFGWTYVSGNGGVAEAAERGGLDVIYYGRVEVLLVSQMLRLAPGRYRLAMRVAGPSGANGLVWNILCVPGNKAVFDLPLGNVGNRATSGLFDIAATDCPAQILELRGRPGESSEPAQLTISDFKLERVAAGS